MQSKIDKNIQLDTSPEENVDYIEDFEIQDETTKTDIIAEETSDFISTKTNDITTKNHPQKNSESPQIQTTENQISTKLKENLPVGKESVESVNVKLESEENDEKLNEKVEIDENDTMEEPELGIGEKYFITILFIIIHAKFG